MQRSIGPLGFLLTAPLVYFFLFARDDVFHGELESGGEHYRAPLPVADLAAYETLRFASGAMLAWWAGVIGAVVAAFAGHPAWAACLAIAGVAFLLGVIGSLGYLTGPDGPYRRVADVLLGS